MPKLIILISYLTIYSSIFCQDPIDKMKNYNGISGAIQITQNNQYQIQFTGSSSPSILGSYSALTDYKKKNCIWIKYTAQKEGELEFTATSESKIQFVIFETYNNPKEEVLNGSAEIKRISKNFYNDSIGISETPRDGHLYSLLLKKNETIYINIGTEKGENTILKLDWKFKFKTKLIYEKLVDKRNDDFAPTFRIKIIDQESKHKLVSKIRITGSKKNDASYYGSELLLNIYSNTEVKIHISQEGYLFVDTTIKASSIQNQNIDIPMHRIRPGGKVKLNNIHFEAGTDEITPESYESLHKLREFLALNAYVKIEIHGHVSSNGKNSIIAKKISEDRAKKITKFLISNGIHKNRLTPIGYGNLYPINENSKTSSEHQENRRVEILIL